MEKLYESKIELIKDTDKCSNTNEIISTLDRIAIDGKWGSGKSFLISHLISHLELKHKDINVLYIDVWKYDYFQEVEKMILINVLEYMLKDTNKCKEQLISILKVAGLSYIESLEDDIEPLKKLLNVVKKTRNFLIAVNDMDREKELSEKLDKLIFDSALPQILLNSGINIIVFDELDRVLPETFLNVIKFLKYSKEEFEDVAFVSSVNLEEAKSIVKHMYGQSYNSEAYFDKMYKKIYQVNNIAIDKALYIYNVGNPNNTLETYMEARQNVSLQIEEFVTLKNYVTAVFLNEQNQKYYGFNEFELREFSNFIKFGMDSFDIPIYSIRYELLDEQQKLRYIEFVMNIFYLELSQFHRTRRIEAIRSERASDLSNPFRFKRNTGGMTNVRLDFEKVLNLYMDHYISKDIKKLLLSCDNRMMEEIKK